MGKQKQYKHVLLSANIAAVDGNGETALQMAARIGKTETVQALVQLGGDLVSF
jgi:ankyrin repeat protein